MKKRDHIQIVEEEEEEEEDDEEDEEEDDDEEGKKVFIGHSMFELYSVVINEIKGNHIQGRIIFERYESYTRPLVIYNGDEGEKNKIGEPLLLRGMSEPFLACDPFSILFDICPKELEPWRKVWVYPPSNDGVVTKEIVREEWGKVTLTYQMFDEAVRARVNVMFLGHSSMDDDGKKKYPSHVYGEIYATCDGRIDTKVVLFRRNSKEEAEPVHNGEPFLLSRSVIAAQLGTRLHIHADLWGCYDSSDVQTSFVLRFKVRSHASTDEVQMEPPCYESSVQVKVTWLEPRHGGCETFQRLEYDASGRPLGELIFP